GISRCEVGPAQAKPPLRLPRPAKTWQPADWGTRVRLYLSASRAPLWHGLLSKQPHRCRAINWLASKSVLTMVSLGRSCEVMRICLARALGFRYFFQLTSVLV